MAKKEEQALATTTGDELTAGMTQEMLDQYGGAGTSQEREDNLIPFLSVIQKTSPIADPDSEQYDEEAKVGEIMNMATGERYDSLIVQPCHFAKADVEWTLRENGGGLVAQHEIGAFPEEDIHVDEKGNRITPAGTQLVETKYHTVIAYPEGGEPFGAIVALSSTGLKVSRTWMQLMNSFKVNTAKGRVTVPSFARKYRLSTEAKKNAKGTWRQLKVEDLGFITDESELLAGRELFDNMVAGNIKADNATADQSAAEEDAETPIG